LIPFPFIFLRRYRFHFHHFLSLARTAAILRPPCSRAHPSSCPALAKHVLAPPLRVVFLPCMRVITLCDIRSNTNLSGEMAVEGASIPDSQAAWVRSTMTEAKIQVTIYHILFRIRIRIRILSNTNTKRIFQIRIHIRILTRFTT
jgi:hypothetical protein